MTIHKFFPDDDNEVLMKVQQECAPELAGALFETARDRYLVAVNLVGISLVMAEVVRSMNRRDYRPLAGAYDIIAAHYRHAYPGANQLPLFSSEPLYRNEPLADKWTRYYYTETWRLVHNDDDLCRNVVMAGTYSGRDQGRLAASQVMRSLSRMYNLQEWAFPAVSATYED